MPNEACVFCQIIKGDLPGKFVYRDREIVVFRDIAPKAPIHVLVVPVKHIPSVSEVGNDDQHLLGRLFLVMKEVAGKLGLSKSGYKLVVNNGRAAGQLVDHLHIHLLGGWKGKVDLTFTI